MQDEIHVKVHSYGPGRPLGLVWFDPITGMKVAKSAGTTNRGKAERKAAVLQDELTSGRYKPKAKITWEEFRERYEKERLAALAPATRKSSGSAFNLVERLLNPDRLAKVTTAAMSQLIAKLKAEGMKDSTLAHHLRHLKASLRWANRMGLLVNVPTFDMPRAGESKGRPITEEEFERMLAETLKARPHDAAAWQRVLTGLWLSGLRLGEAVVLSWDDDAPFAVDLSGKFPAFRIEAKAQKGRRDERLPMTPDFAEWLLRTPEAERVGRVFSLRSQKPGQVGHPISMIKVTVAIAAIGKKALVVVAKDTDTGKVKYASAHDLRRSFGTRWAKKVMPAVLQRLMRHQSIGTTMRYYVGIQADDVAAELWAKHSGGKAGDDASFGNTSGNNRPSEAQSPEGSPVMARDANSSDHNS